MQSQDEAHSFRAVPSAHIAMGAGFWLLLGLWAFVAAKNPTAQGTGLVLCVIVLVVGLVHAWLFAFRLEIGNGWIRYRSLLQRSRTIRLEDIASVDSAPSGVRRHSEAMLPPLRVEIFLKSRPEALPIVINLKVFSREALALLRDRLSPVAAGAR
jgi:hypothetical protein